MANKSSSRRGSPFNLTSPGTAFTIGFIALAIGMGILLSQGITPGDVLSDPGPQVEHEIITETPAPGKNNLQLKILHFKDCSDNMTVDLLLDRSDSMGELTPSGAQKLDRLKNAVSTLISKTGDQSVVGIQSFSSISITNDVPISFYKDIKASIQSKIDALQHGGQTPTYDALNYSYGILKNAVADSRFKDRKFNFIFISDGAPCPGFGCVGESGTDEDPRKYSPNPADEIKSLGVNVYSLGIFSSGQNDPAFSELLKNIASAPSNYFAAQTGDEIPQLLGQISSKICDGAN